MKPRVLIADADAELCKTFGEFFRQVGQYEVETAAGGVECVAKLRQSLPDALILDLDLPWGGCEGVLAWLREHCDRDRDPIIVLIGQRSSKFVDWNVTPSILHYLRKPVHATELLQSISAATPI